MTRLGRLLDSTVKSLTRAAVGDALKDAALHQGAVQAAFFSNTVQSHMEGQIFIRGEIALRDMGFQGIPMVNVENACASGATALYLATQYLKAGEGDCALAVGVEKMYSPDKAKMFSVFDSGWDISTVDRNRDQLLALGHGVEVPAGGNSTKPYSVFMDVYAAFTRFHMKRYGTTQRQIAAVAAKNHAHSVHNEKSQYRNSYTVEEILAAAPIAYPLTLPMCAPISDGGAAVVVCTAAGMKRLGLSRERAVEIKSIVLQTGTNRQPQEVDQHITAIAARRAYEKAGVGPADISVAEVHDATAPGEIIQTENLGLCAPGEGGPAAERGETTIGGRIPVNPSGGLESKGHPIGTSGLGQIYELTTQLRHEAGARQVANARLAIAENGGGLYGIEEAVAAITILGRAA
jgi:acetyl-CoA acetyltransferase